MTKPVLVHHSRHPLPADRRLALAAYRIVTVNSYTTDDIDDIWLQARMAAGCVPDALMTTRGRHVLADLCKSARLASRLKVDGTPCVILKSVMLPNAPDVWSGKFQRVEWDARLNRVVYETWSPVSSECERGIR